MYFAESEEEEEEVIAVQSETSLTLASSGSPRKKPKFRPYSEGDDPNWEVSGQLKAGM